MLITAGKPPFGEQDIRCASWEDDRFLVYWKGLIFLYGFRSGTASIEQLAKQLRNTSLKSISRQLHGVFGVFVLDKKRLSWHIAVDNSGLYHVFYDEDTVSTSFLELLAFRGLSSRHIAPNAVAEFLAHGWVHWRRTLVDGIAKIGHDEIIELQLGSGAGNVKRIVRKELPPLGGNRESFLTHYAYLARALAGRRVSVDLTGGFDSRLNACLLAHYGLEFEVAISGRPGISDVVIPEQAAKLLGKQLYITLHDVSSLDEDLPKTFQASDGLIDVLAYHRVQQMQAARRSRGIELAVSGEGGGLYKDFWWLQDIPRYSSRWINFERLYDLRIEPSPLPHHYLAGDVAEAYNQLRRQTIEQFATLAASTNTESYDNLYFYYKSPASYGSFLTIHINSYLDVATPLLDYDNAMVGFGLPRAARCFNWFHRQLLSEKCPQLARLMTSSGVSASTDGSHMAGDAFSYGMGYGRLLFRKIGQRLFGRTWLPSATADEPTMRSRVRRSPAFLQSLGALKDLRIIAAELSPEAVGDVEIGRVLTLGLLVRHLGC